MLYCGFCQLLQTSTIATTLNELNCNLKYHPDQGTCRNYIEHSYQPTRKEAFDSPRIEKIIGTVSKKLSTRVLATNRCNVDKMNWNLDEKQQVKTI